MFFFLILYTRWNNGPNLEKIKKILSDVHIVISNNDLSNEEKCNCIVNNDHNVTIGILITCIVNNDHNVTIGILITCIVNNNHNVTIGILITCIVNNDHDGTIGILIARIVNNSHNDTIIIAIIGNTIICTVLYPTWILQKNLYELFT